MGKLENIKMYYKKKAFEKHEAEREKMREDSKNKHGCYNIQVKKLFTTVFVAIQILKATFTSLGK